MKFKDIFDKLGVNTIHSTYVRAISDGSSRMVFRIDKFGDVVRITNLTLNGITVNCISDVELFFNDTLIQSASKLSDLTVIPNILLPYHNINVRITFSEDIDNWGDLKLQINGYFMSYDDKWKKYLTYTTDPIEWGDNGAVICEGIAGFKNA